jgi:hypothetical protein
MKVLNYSFPKQGKGMNFLGLRQNGSRREDTILGMKATLDFQLCC